MTSHYVSTMAVSHIILFIPLSLDNRFHLYPLLSNLKNKPKSV